LFFKQKTAYEIRLSLVGSEMCISRQLCSQRVVSQHPRANAENEEQQEKSPDDALAVGGRKRFEHKVS